MVSPLWTDALSSIAVHFTHGANSRGKHSQLPPSLPGYSSAAVVDMLLAMCPPVRKLEVRIPSVQKCWFNDVFGCSGDRSKRLF